MYQNFDAAPPSRFESAVVPPHELHGPAWWYVFRDSKLLVHENGLGAAGAAIPCVVHPGDLGLAAMRQQYLGVCGGQHCFSAELGMEVEAPPGMSFEGLRGLYGRLEETHFALAGRAFQIVDWDRTHQFCGRCGSGAINHASERAKQCPRCGLLNYPRLCPAVMVLVERGNEVLLARSHHFATGMHSVLAGFVEPGESLEEAAQREVWEEVGLTIGDLRYFGSQPWPFPNSLMIAYTAEHVAGEIHLDTSEIEQAGWFTADSMPTLPGPISLARRLINWFLVKHGRTFYTL
jgi:NAD+ diphosphatase